MPRLEVYSFAPGETASISIAVKGTNVASARLVSKLDGTDLPADIVSDKTITTVLTADGQVVYTAPDSVVTFRFLPAETVLYDPLAPYYVFDVEVTDTDGNKFRLGESKIAPQPSTLYGAP